MIQSGSFLLFQKGPSVGWKMASGANHSRLTSMTYASGYVLTYNYGSGLDSTISRLTSLSDSANTLESYTYLGLGTVVKRAHPQSGVDLSYIKLSGESTGDAGDQYTGLDRFGRIVDQRWINGSNADVDRFRYGYDRNGNRTYKENVVNTALSEVYTHDDLGQIASYKLGTLNSGKTDVTGTPTNSQSWDYDATGNWDSITTNSTTQTRSANKQNEITSVSGATTPTYDNNGNLTKDENNYRFVYDAWNRQVIIKNASDALITTKAFNGINQNVKVVAGSSTIDRIFSTGWQDLEDKSGSGTVTRNVWSPTYVDALVLRDRDTDANGTLDERLFALQDANYNVTAITNSSGAVQEKYTYTPFGVVTYRDASGSTVSSSSKAWVFLHQGGQINIAGEYDFRNRVLSPTLGRWLTNDPLGFNAGDVNLIRYNRNNPTKFLDPTGLQDTYGDFIYPYQRQFGIGVDFSTCKYHKKIRENVNGIPRTLDVYTCKTDSGDQVIFVSDPGNLGWYHCHGLTFGGRWGLPNKFITPIGDDIPKIIASGWDEKDCNVVGNYPITRGIIVIWYDDKGDITHSAPVSQTGPTGPMILPSKNADDPIGTYKFDELIIKYGKKYKCFVRK